MNFIRCPKNHFYDADQYQACPICGGGTAPSVNETVTFSSMDSDSATVALRPDSFTATMPLDNEFGVTMPVTPLEDDVTQSIYELDLGAEPVVGWLVCTKGNHFGKDFRLKEGRNFVGRGPNMDVALTGESSVSRDKHAIIIYEPKQSTFLVMAGDAKELFYLNGDVVLTAMVLKKGDRLQLGEVELMFVPCCDDTFLWQNEEGKKGREKK